MRPLFALFFASSLAFGAGVSTLKSAVLNGKDVQGGMNELISRCESGNAGACGAIGEIAAAQGDKKFASKYLKKSCDLGGNCGCYENFKAGKAVKSCEVKFAKNAQKSAPKKSASQASKDEAELEAMINSGKFESQSVLFSGLPEQKPDAAESPKSAPAQTQSVALKNNSNLNTNSNLKPEQNAQKTQTATSKSEKSESETNWVKVVIIGLVALYFLHKFAAWGFWLCAIGAVIAFFSGSSEALVFFIGGVILFAILGSIGSGSSGGKVVIDWANREIIRKKFFGSDETIYFWQIKGIGVQDRELQPYHDKNGELKNKTTKNYGVIVYYRDGSNARSFLIECDSLGEMLDFKERFEREIENKE